MMNGDDKEGGMPAQHSARCMLHIACLLVMKVAENVMKMPSIMLDSDEK